MGLLGEEICHGRQSRTTITIVVLSHLVPKGGSRWTNENLSLLPQAGHRCYPLHFHRAESRKRKDKWNRERSSKVSRMASNLTVVFMFRVYPTGPLFRARWNRHIISSHILGHGTT